MEKEVESKRNISEEWLRNNVYEALEKIEECERRMMNGCADLIEYMQEMGIKPNRLPEIMLKNMEIIIKEFDILIENTREILTRERYDLARRKLDFCIKIQLKERLFKVIINQVNKRVPNRIILLRSFDDLANDLCRLRSEMVSNLSHILFLKDKSKEKKRKEL